MKTILGVISDFCYFNYRGILLFSLLLGLLLLTRIGSLTIETNILKLFPQHTTSIGTFTELIENFGSFNKLYLLVEKRKSLNLNEFLTEADRFVQYLNSIRINKIKAFTDIHYKFSILDEHKNAKNILTIFIDNPLHFLEYTDIPLLSTQLSDENIFLQLSKRRKLLVGNTSYALKEYIEIDPLELKAILQPKFRITISGFQFDFQTSYFLSPDQQSLLIIASPALSAQDIEFSKQLMNTITQYSVTQKNISITCTGASAITVSNETVIRKDIKISLLTSLIGVLLLFYIVYRRPFILIFVSIPITIGIVSTFAIASATIGTINILTSAFSAIVVGLGIDFSIHLYDRFHSERAQGNATRDALRLTLQETGTGMLTAGITTALGFLSLCGAQVTGIIHFGFLVAIGILSCMLSTYFILPSLLVWLDKNRSRYPYEPLKSYGLSFLSQYLQKHSISFLVISLLLSLIMGYYCLHLSFENDLTNVRLKGEQNYAVQNRIKQQFGNRGTEFFIYREGKDLNDLITQEDQLIEILNRHMQEGEIKSFLSCGLILNTEEKQRTLVQNLTTTINIHKVSNSFDSYLEKLNFKKPRFYHMRNLLKTLYSAPQTLITPPEVMFNLLRTGLLQRVIDNCIMMERGTFKILTYLFLRDEKPPSASLVADLTQVDHNVKIVGIPLINQEILAMVKSDFLRCFFLALFLILVCLYIHFRSVTLMLLVLIPLGMGMVWMLGSMALLGMRLNVINAVILPMIIGTGVDSGVYIVQRYLAEASHRIKKRYQMQEGQLQWLR